VTAKPPVRVEIAIPVVKKLKRIFSEYPHVYDDLQELIHRLERGETPGDHMKGVGYTVYKVRVRNTDALRGKRGGYRAIYYIRTADHIILISIYSKTDRINIEADEIGRLIEGLK
jgi:mRNA-degrading endonuclease RelE of RelBE toxin-antitoxin system